MNELPDWTAFTSGETRHRGIDPLGLAAIGSSIVQRRLLPGITNSTKHVRYYSFFCWVFWTFWHYRTTTARRSEQRKWRARLENVLRAATLWRGQYTIGLVGRRKAIDISGLSPDKAIPIDRSDVVSAFIPAFYSSSFRALGCGRWTDDRGAQLTGFGERLAKAFDFGMRQSPASRNALPTILASERTVPVKAVRAVADAIRLREVEPGVPEHSLLLELLLRLNSGANNPSWQARSRSFALLMEIVAKANKALHSDHDVHDVFATGRLPNKEHFDVPPELSQDFEIWKRYQERQYVKLGIYALWHEVVRILDYRASKTANVPQILRRFHAALERSRVIRKWLGPRYVRLTVGKAEELLRQRLRDKPHDFGKSAMSLVEILEGTWSASSERIGAAIVLLLFVSCYWIEFQSQLEESRLHREGGRDRLSLDVVAMDADQMGTVLLPDYMEWIVENYVLKQATKIALEKLPDYRYFIVRDDDGYRLVKKQRNPSSYLSFDPSRIGSAFSLMFELKLLDSSAGYRLTRSGRKVLEELRVHHRRG